jgi:short subunit dehydrogenase-like uncharacterized protein
MSTKPSWMIYGAYGYTGRLLVGEALRRGHRPLLAGRSAKKLAPLAGQTGLEWVEVSLDDETHLAEVVGQVKLVFHAAGPFIETSLPMLRACLQMRSHYIDITGEIPVFEQTFAHDREAREKRIALLSGAGMDIVPSDCLVKYVADQVPNATELESAVAFRGGGVSAGTLQSGIEMAPRGGLARKDGKLVSLPLGSGSRRVSFSDRERIVIPVSWGDLVTGFHSTGIPNITTYMGFPNRRLRLLRNWGARLQTLLIHDSVRRLARWLVKRFIQGPSQDQRRLGRSFFWAAACDPEGGRAEAWLEGPESYKLTAEVGVLAAEKVLNEQFSGALTPSKAFGADFILQVDSVRRIDKLDE